MKFSDKVGAILNILQNIVTEYHIETTAVHPLKVIHTSHYLLITIIAYSMFKKLPVWLHGRHIVAFCQVV